MKEVLITLILFPMIAVGQQATDARHFLCSNNWDIKIGDTIQLGSGSQPDKSFKYIYRFRTDLAAKYAGIAVKVKRIVKLNDDNNNAELTVDNDTISKHTISIEDAIYAKEVVVPKEFETVTPHNRHSGNSYKASNGITYYIGDTITMGMGSMPNGDFKWLNIGGWYAVLAYNSNAGTSQFNIGKYYAGTNVIIKGIRRYKQRGIEKVVFVINGGNITNYNLYIEEAIQSCEIKDCLNNRGGNTTIINQPSVADELVKFKKLKDEGVITDEEFQKQKEKLLNK